MTISRLLKRASFSGHFLRTAICALAVLFSAGPKLIAEEGGSPMIREAAVAGQFYPSRASDIDSFFSSVLKPAEKKADAVAIVVPHAGYIYSGKIAAKAYGEVSIPENIILLGPNHTGRGTPVSVFEKGAWMTPYGKVPVNEAFTKELLAANQTAKPDVSAHIYEHSLEVQLPFLQYVRKDPFKIVPVAIAERKKDALKAFAKALADTIRKSGEKTLIIASTDLSHYESAAAAKEKDGLCIAAIASLDEEKLWQVVQDKDISMCGYLPVYVTIIAAKELGAKEGKLLQYGTSGDVTGNQAEVVGYAAMMLR